MPTETIHRIWAQHLKLADFSDDDDFFTLGGHSLIMVAIQSDLNAELGVEVPMDELFRHLTVNELADWLSRVPVHT